MANPATRTVPLLIGVLALVALCSFAQGLVHALNAPKQDEAVSVGDPSRDPVPVAKALAPGVVLDEARVRQIAREEADAALVRSHPKKAAPKPDADDTASPAVDDLVKPAQPIIIPVAPPPAPGPQ